ncbi:hypothetical protein [Chitinolyticbacter albus]|uniref:hypothetical protein n=1 Tax=Chitinolyticbacter albus TaxID=2961951 RepID=UPI00210E7021|nr:hypothetical protein [Chitinolyticbacter albus]
MWGALVLKPDKGAVIVVDDRQVSTKDLKYPISGMSAYVLGANASSFGLICEHVDVERLDFYQMRVADLSPLRRVQSLKHLAIRSNSQVSEIEALSDLGLETLILEHTPKVSDLAPIGKISGLKALAYTGGMDKANTALTLDPLTDLGELEEIDIRNIRIVAEGVEPLARCRRLRRLYISNQHPTEEIAYLAAKLSGTSCSLFKAWTSVQPLSETNNNVMVTGSRKPFLHLERDAEKIRRYEQEFETLVKRFASNKSFHRTASGRR